MTKILPRYTIEHKQTSFIKIMGSPRNPAHFHVCLNELLSFFYVRDVSQQTTASPKLAEQVNTRGTTVTILNFRKLGLFNVKHII